jgi:hypothetical protein
MAIEDSSKLFDSEGLILSIILHNNTEEVYMLIIILIY